MKIIKGNIIFTPSKDNFKVIENGYIVLNKNKIVEVCSKLDEESNPVLLKIRLKDF
jgi:guanine deaminase